MVSGYADVVVMRTPWEGAAKAASLYSHVPVVNAGDGGHMHPTQTTADLTTITRLLGRVDGLSVGLCGDLKNGRTVHSLIKALAKFEDIRFFLISPRELAVPDYMRAFMQENGMRFTEVTGLEAVIPQLDVLYMTRIQRERFVDPLEYERNKGVYILTRRKLERAKEKMLVMHPLPRVDEITVDVDDDPRAAYFQQARYGMFARMALLADLANQPRLDCTQAVEIGTRPVCRNPRCITQTEHYLPPLVKKNGGVDCCAFCDGALL
jgi:aspartate carbamoyltransferase catalytic subunit